PNLARVEPVVHFVAARSRMIRQDQPQCTYTFRGADRQFALVAEELLIESVHVRCMRRPLAQAPHFAKGREHVVQGLRVRRSEGLLQPILEYLDRSLLLDHDLPVRSLLLGLIWHLTLEKV